MWVKPSEDKRSVIIANEQISTGWFGRIGLLDLQLVITMMDFGSFIINLLMEMIMSQSSDFNVLPEINI